MRIVNMANRSIRKRIRNLPKMEEAKPKTRGERKIRTDNLKRVSKAKALDKTVKANAEKAKAKVGTKTGMRASRTPDKISGSGMKAENRTLSRAAERGKKIMTKAVKAARTGSRAIKGLGYAGAALTAADLASEYASEKAKGEAGFAKGKKEEAARKRVMEAAKAKNTKPRTGQSRGKAEESARQRVMSEAKAKNTGQSKPAATSKPATTGGMTGKRAHNIVRIEKTKGGDYPVFKKGSAESKSFRKAYGEAKSGVFTWEGRKYKKP